MSFIVNKIKFLVSFLLLIIVFNICFAKNSKNVKLKSTKSLNLTKNKKKIKNKKNLNYQGKKVSKKAKKKRIRATPNAPIYGYEITKARKLGEGVNYYNFIFDRGKFNNSVNVIEADLEDKKWDLKLIKGFGLSSELQKLHEIVEQYNQKHEDKVVVAVNGSFWRAYTNTPIGPTIINGEVVEFPSHKSWSCIFFDKFEQPYIDSFKLSGEIILKGKSIEIDNINRRNDSNQIVIYNKFGGNEIPFLSPSKYEKVLVDRYKKKESELEMMADSTEEDYSFEVMKQENIKLIHSLSIEKNTKKIVVQYLTNPKINEKTQCLVLTITSGTVGMPINGFIISLPSNFNDNLLPEIGDRIELFIKTNVNQENIFYNGLCGTPRLVRNGRAKHEAQLEGSKGKRFINDELSRTCIGYDKEKSKLYLATIEPNIGDNSIKGVNLNFLSQIMLEIGCYDAMNLDGGGSSAMIIDNQNVNLKPRMDFSRKMAIGVGISIKK